MADRKSWLKPVHQGPLRLDSDFLSWSADCGAISPLEDVNLILSACRLTTRFCRHS